MSKFLRHEPCPECRKVGHDRKGNNLGVYDDHVHCFACGYSGFNGVVLRRELYSAAPAARMKNEVRLPPDVTTCINHKALSWLAKYELTREEVTRHKFLWSDEKQLLIYPIFGEDNNLIAFNGRYFGDNPDYPKYFSKGNLKDTLVILGTDYSRIILTEDIISAIKVARVCASCCLFGSILSSEQAVRLKRHTSHVTLWLDYDKRVEALKYASKAKLHGLETSAIISERDPKCYSTEEIQTYLGD